MQFSPLQVLLLVAICSFLALTLGFAIGLSSTGQSRAPVLTIKGDTVEEQIGTIYNAAGCQTVSDIIHNFNGTTYELPSTIPNKFEATVDIGSDVTQYTSISTINTSC